MITHDHAHGGTFFYVIAREPPEETSPIPILATCTSPCFPRILPLFSHTCACEEGKENSEEKECSLTLGSSHAGLPRLVHHLTIPLAISLSGTSQTPHTHLCWSTHLEAGNDGGGGGRGGCRLSVRVDMYVRRHSIV